MNIGKLIINPNPTHHISNRDENSYISVTFLKNTGRTGGKLRPQDKSSTRLQELSIMNKTYVGEILYYIHLGMKLDYTISGIFQEISLSELETLHRLCELERTQIIQSLHLQYQNYLMQDIFWSGNRSNCIDYEGSILCYYTCTKKVSPLNVFEDKRCFGRIPIFYKNKVHFVDTFSRFLHFVGIQLSIVDLKIATMLYK